MDFKPRIHTDSLESGYASSSYETDPMAEQKAEEFDTNCQLSIPLEIRQNNLPEEASPVSFPDVVYSKPWKSVTNHLKRNISIYTSIILACFFCIIFSKVAENLASYSDTNEDNPQPRPGRVKKAQHFIADKAIIKSYEDLINIKGYPQMLEIISLTTPKSSEELPTNGYVGTVNDLNVSGSITEEWLMHLLGFFPNIYTVHLNIDGLCQGANVADRDTLKILNLTRVLHLSIEHSNLCPIINWVFKWNLPKIRAIKLARVDFNRKSFKGFCNFLNRSQEAHKSLMKVVMQDCSLCEDCDMTQIPKGIVVSVA